MTSIVEVIQHYQRSIDSSQDNEARLLHCINKLYKLPIKVEHLQETGVGKTVNSLRKFNGEIGVAAKTLVTKWKAMVAAEEEPMDTTSQTNESETQNDNNDEGGTTPHGDEDDENHNRNNTSQQEEQSKHRSGDKHKERHKDRSSGSSNGPKESRQSSSSSSSHHEKSSKHSSDKNKSKSSKNKSSGSSKEGQKEKTDHKSSSDRHKERGKDDKEQEHSEKKRDEKSRSDKELKTESPHSHSSHHKSSSHTSNSNSSSVSKSKHEDKHSQSSSKDKDKERSEKHKSSSKDKERTKEDKQTSHTSSRDKHENKSSSTSSTSKSSTKDPESAERKRRLNSDNDSNDFKSPPPKAVKVHKSSSSTAASKQEFSPPQEAAEEEGADDSFDSSMGANFDDVLGMLNMPMKKSKKSLKSPSTPTSSSTDRKDTTPHKPSTSNSSSAANKVNGSRTSFTSSTLYSTPSTSKITAMKPDLLAPTAKLEPLDPSIALELPTISTNYKPMPLNQTVMDCVFNTSSSSKSIRILNDVEAMSHAISSKTMRTKIYSGIRTGQTFQVPTLFDMCIRILQKNIDALEYTGGVPFEVLKPVLDRASPQQLYVFEEYNPYLMEDSDILWQQHVSRNYRTKKRMENESWREMYIRCQDEEERRLSVLKDSIKASQKIAAAPIRKTQMAFVDSMVKPPRNVLKKQEQYGTKSKMVATPAARVAALSSVTPNAGKTGDLRLKVPTTVRDHAQVSSSTIRTKKAPLMQKTLQFIRGRHKR